MTPCRRSPVAGTGYRRPASRRVFAPFGNLPHGGSARAPRGGTRANSRPWGINAILARTAGRLSSSIASGTALAGWRLSNAVAARTASRAA